MRWAIVGVVKLYQATLRPLLPPACRYSPSCSEYMIEAVTVHGGVRGFFLGARRLFRCHPWGGYGYDPVPPRS